MLRQRIQTTKALSYLGVSLSMCPRTKNKSTRNTQPPVRHNKHRRGLFSTLFLCALGPRGTAHRNITPLLHLPLPTSHSLLKDETPEKGNEWRSQFKTLWVKFQTCRRMLPNCQHPQTMETWVSSEMSLALRIWTSQSALNQIAETVLCTHKSSHSLSL